MNHSLTPLSLSLCVSHFNTQTRFLIRAFSNTLFISLRHSFFLSLSFYSPILVIVYIDTLSRSLSPSILSNNKEYPFSHTLTHSALKQFVHTLLTLSNQQFSTLSSSLSLSLTHSLSLLLQQQLPILLLTPYQCLLHTLSTWLSHTNDAHSQKRWARAYSREFGPFPAVVVVVVYWIWIERRESHAHRCSQVGPPLKARDAQFIQHLRCRLRLLLLLCALLTRSFADCNSNSNSKNNNKYKKTLNWR